MKKFSKILSVALLVALVLSLGVTSAFAGTGTITITPPTGLDDEATNTYYIYKVFDGVGDGNGHISYTLVDGKTTVPSCFEIVNGNINYTGTGGDELTAGDIAAIKAYIADDEPVATVTATGSTAVTTEANLDDGYYFISTTTGTVVTIDSTNHNASVEDKNRVPEVDKKITGANSIDDDGKKALAQVGTTVNYTGDITVGKGAKGYIFHDTMETGLAYNSDAKVYIGTTEVDTANYTIDKEGDKLDGDTFSISFDDDYMKTLAVGTVLTVKYSATVTDEAITTDPLNNTCYVSYGDKNANNRTPDDEADVYEAKISVLKKNGKNTPEETDDDPLAGAGFVLKKTVDSATKYYHLATVDGKPVVQWVDEYADEDIHTSGEDGQVPAFVGLPDGSYTLEEVVVPTGFNKASDVTITIAAHNYTAENLEQEATVINNQGTALPSTGGIGTTIFYAVGGILVLAAIVLLITKKRMSD